MITCRTIDRVGEGIYAGLIVVGCLVGVIVIVLGMIYGPVSVVGVGLFFLLVGARGYYIELMHTASELSLNTVAGDLTWRATRGHGELAISEIEQVARSNRPTVFQFICADGSKTAFWLSRRDSDVTSLFNHLRTANPNIIMSDLYRRKGLWWRGLPAS